MPTIRRFLVVIVTTGIVAVPAGASASVTLDGSFSIAVQKPNFAGICPSGVADECGTMQLIGLGAADWAYVSVRPSSQTAAASPWTAPSRSCCSQTGARSPGPLTGGFCPRPSATGHQHRSPKSFGNPFVEDDSVAFAGGTGQFAELFGVASFHTFSAGARFKGTLIGTLSG